MPGAGDLGTAPDPRKAATIRELTARAAAFLRPKLADFADLFMLGVILFATGVSLLNRSWLFTGSALSASMVGFALCYLIASRCMRSQKDLGVQRVFISLAVMVSGVWLFEIAYHYGWLVPISFLQKDLMRFDINTPQGTNPFPLPWAFIMVCLAATGIRYMRLNRWFYLCAALAFGTMVFWIAIGYPNYFHPEWWPHKPIYLQVIPREFANALRPPGSDTIAFWGGFMNSLTKVLVSIVPATLFVRPGRAALSANGERGLNALWACAKGWVPGSPVRSSGSEAPPAAASHNGNAPLPSNPGGSQEGGEQPLGGGSGGAPP